MATNSSELARPPADSRWDNGSESSRYLEFYKISMLLTK